MSEESTTEKFTICIDKNVPLVPRRSEMSSNSHPLRTMLEKLEVGDSFMWPRKAPGGYNNLRSVACYYGRKWGRKFTGRLVSTGARSVGLRFWRTA